MSLNPTSTTFSPHFTGTNGLGEKIIQNFTLKADNDFQGIQTVKCFIKKYNNKKGQLNKKYQLWDNFLKNLTIEINKKYNNYVDPIQYFIFLYYNEGLPIKSIYKKYEHLIGNIHIDTFRRFFTNILGWKLRDSNDRTEIQIKRNKITKNTTNLESENKNKTIIAQSKFNKAIQSIIEVSEINFNSLEFDKIKYKKNKIIYVISFLLQINTNQVVSELIRLNNLNIGYNTISNGLMKLLNNNTIQIPINITKHNIKNLIKSQ